jgi:hypothetical protein
MNEAMSIKGTHCVRSQWPPPLMLPFYTSGMGVVLPGKC